MLKKIFSMALLLVLLQGAAQAAGFIERLNIFAFLDRFDEDKLAAEDVKPQWVHLGMGTTDGRYNLNTAEVIYAFDKATARTEKNSDNFKFLLAKKTKAKNEIEVLTLEVAKDKKYYQETQKLTFFLDGSLKSAEALPGTKKKLKEDDTVFANVHELAKSKDLGSMQYLAMPKLPDGFNSYVIKKGKKGMDDWFCFVDGRASGLSKDDMRLLTVVTYAFNPKERVYYKEETLCKKTDTAEYQILEGTAKLYTYYGRLLRERHTKYASSVNRDAFDETVKYYYQFYRN